jgi:hypothetical protein
LLSCFHRKRAVNILSHRKGAKSQNKQTQQACHQDTKSQRKNTKLVRGSLSLDAFVAEKNCLLPKAGRFRFTETLIYTDYFLPPGSLLRFPFFYGLESGVFYLTI